MCGIAGEYQRSGSAATVGVADLEADLEAMIRTLGHRGPDGTGIHLDGEAGLAHARLSIIDPAGGSQPMSNNDGSLWITFHGEIFNYKELREDLRREGHVFRTQSDTEVLLRMYEEKGERCVEYLNGQWAFAIWNSRDKTLFLSRDGFGICPLYYAQNSGSFLFASEVKALFSNPSLPRELDPDAMDDAFTFWFPVAPATMFRGVRELPPGHSMTVSRDKVTTTRHWQISYEPHAVTDENETAEELLEKLREATRLRMRADVTVGAYLSGGLDSTLTTALVRQVSGASLTFSIGFDEADYDETGFQTEAARFLGTEHEQMRCTAEDIRRVFPDVIWHAERTILRTAPAPMFLLSKLVSQRGIKVVVTGEGADELFGGYDIFKETKVRRFLAAQPESRLRPLLLRRLYPYMPAIQAQPDAYLRSFFQAAKAGQAGNAGPFFSHGPRWDLTSRLKQFWSAEFRARVGQRDACAQLEMDLPKQFGRWGWLERAQYLETAYLLPGYILSSQGDRMAMANAVEGRFPFLDPDVAAFASRLPASLKLRVLNEKPLLKQAARGLIPESVRTRFKQPYRAPDANVFFRPKMTEYAAELLSPQRIARDGVFEPRAVERLTRKFQSGLATGVRDNMALTGILSTQLLIHQFLQPGSIAK